MSTRTSPDGDRPRTPRTAIVMLALGLVFVALAVWIVWFAMVTPSYSVTQRVAGASLGIGGGILFAAIEVGLARTYIQGRPRIAATPAGLAVDRTTVPWTAFEGAGSWTVLGLPNLVVGPAEPALDRMRMIDRIAMRFGPKTPEGMRLLVISEAQLGTAVELALRVVPDRLKA